MHPILGDFISRNFYERFSADERVASGLTESVFTHNLPGTDNRAAAWMNVPVDMGRHSRRGTSWVRQAEAEVIADKLVEWISSEQGKDLTYGVISFYKAQAELIKKSLGQFHNDEKKLRIGTVDSFQGMEFDVVFLSMVRTLPTGIDLNHEQAQNDAPARKRRGGFLGLFGKSVEKEIPNQILAQEGPIEKKQAQKYFGHLCLYNRLNVSMSRQKKLLVVVGDQGLLNNSLAEKYIPGLVDFHNMCSQGGVFLSCK
jgi:superfamily I DNA and/or RNA helicase